MNQKLMVTVRDVSVEDHEVLRGMVVRYWNELMPDAHVVRAAIGEGVRNLVPKVTKERCG